MTRSALVAILAGVSSLWSFPVCAQTTTEQSFWTGSDMLKTCQKWEQYFDAQPAQRRTMDVETRVDAMACVYFVAGISSGMIIGDAYATNNAPRKAVCPPDTVSNGQYVRIGLRFLRQRPELHHENASELFASAFANAFPCPGTPIKATR